MALDEAEDPEERVVALQRLRAAEPDGRTPEVVKSMLELLSRASDPEVREDLCRHLDGAVGAGQEGPLLQALASDSSEAVRAEAAETLGFLRAHPPVRAALERAAREDPSAEVRERAARARNP
jgi:HEAT repeat protein